MSKTTSGTIYISHNDYINITVTLRILGSLCNALCSHFQDCVGLLFGSIFFISFLSSATYETSHPIIHHKADSIVNSYDIPMTPSSIYYSPYLYFISSANILLQDNVFLRLLRGNWNAHHE